MGLKMTITSVIKSIKSRFRPTVVRQVQNNLHSPELFQQRLLIEKRRAERLSSVASVIVFDLDEYRNGRNGHEGHPGLDIAELVKSICAIVRETDVVSLYPKNLILILLPDTDTTVARCVYERLAQKLKRFQHEYSHAETFHLDQIESEILSCAGDAVDEPRKAGRKDAIVMQTKAGRRNTWEEMPVCGVSSMKDGHGNPARVIREIHSKSSNSGNHDESPISRPACPV
jgi:GGDEF domain-containing protein